MSSPTDLHAGQLLAGLARREITALELTRSCLQRIEELDPELNSFLRINPRAEEQAREADRKLASGEARALTGIPVAIKDNLLTAGLETTCASQILREFVPPRDATAVARLRAAGAVILGKTNMDEFGMGSSTENSAYGPARNPWHRDHVPGGSSGGSAVAVAALLAPLALGSDTGGSVRQPAAFCGVVGLKPTYGRISRSGLVAFGSSLDQVGTLSRTVSDAALLLESLAGSDPLDSTSSSRPVGGYLAACRREPVGLRIGIPREYFGHGLDPEIERMLFTAARTLEAAGAELRELSLPSTKYAIPAYYIIATAEAASNLARYDGVRYGPRSDDRSAWQQLYGKTRGGNFGQEVQRRIMLGTYALSAGYYAAYYEKAQKVRSLLRRDFLEQFESGIDLLLTPTTPTTAFRLGEKLNDPLEMYMSDIYTTTANLAGLPALSVPLGSSRVGLPVGAQLIGTDFGEEDLFRAGTALERSAQTGPAPQFSTNPAGSSGSPGPAPEA